MAVYKGHHVIRKRSGFMSFLRRLFIFLLVVAVICVGITAYLIYTDNTSVITDNIPSQYKVYGKRWIEFIGRYMDMIF